MDIGLVGCGFIAQKRHVPSVMEVDGLRISAACDRDGARAAALAEKLGATAYDSLDAMLGRERFDGVIVATGPDAHVEVSLACLARGLPVLTEKPPAVTMADARRLAEAEKASGLPVLVGFNKRSAPIYRQARAAVTAQGFRLTHLSVEYSSGAWGRVVPGMSIDLAMTWHHIHGFDLVRYLGGEVRSLRSLFTGSHDGQGCYATLLRLQCGAVGTLVSSSFQLWQHPFERVAIAGEGEFMVMENFRQARRYASDAEPARLSEPNYSIQPDSGNRLEGFVPQLEHFARCIRGEETPVSSAADACRSLALVHAALRSAREDREIDMERETM